MLLYHPFYFAFSSGSTICVSITGVLVDLMTTVLFGHDPLSLFLILMDITMILLSISSLIFLKTTLFWILTSITYSLFLIGFPIYVFLRFNKMYSNFVKKISIMTMTVIFIAYLIYFLSVRWEIPALAGTLVFIIAEQIPLLVVAGLNYNVMRVIRENPIHNQDVKQSNLYAITKILIGAAFSFSFPCIVLLSLAGLLQNATLLDIAIAFPPYVKLTFSCYNFAVSYNKSKVTRVQTFGNLNTSVFRTII